MEGVKADITIIKSDVGIIKDVQAGRKAEFELYVPKSWLWSFIVLLLPATAVIFSIAVYIATVDGKFARKEVAADHEFRIKAIEQIAMEHHGMMKTMLENQEIIISRLPEK